jgi:hypothetical protein
MDRLVPLPARSVQRFPHIFWRTTQPIDPSIFRHILPAGLNLPTLIWNQGTDCNDGRCIMRKSLSIMAAAAGLLLASGAIAGSVTDPVGDFAGGYIGPHQADLDVTSFSVSYDSGTSSFLLQSTMAGAIDPTLPGFYAIGVNTGTGPNSFASIGLGGVRFNQVIAVQKAGTAIVSGNSLPAGSISIVGDLLSVVVPLSLLPSTGFTPDFYGFNIWPRSGAGGTEVISDFAPDNATVSSSVPEPATWSMMLLGFGALGATLRHRRVLKPV